MRAVVTVFCLVAALAPAGAANVRRIEFQGLQRVIEANVRRNLPLHPGDEYTPEAGEAARRFLVDVGFFIDVKLAATTEGAVVDIVFACTENPLVEMVQFEGNTQIASAAMRPALTTKPGEILGMFAIRADALMIGSLYRDRGLYVTVTPSVSPELRDPNTPVTVTYRISELKVRHVRFEPRGFLRPEAAAALNTLREGDLLRVEDLANQARRLMATGLFESIGEPQSVDTEAPDQVDVIMPLVASNRPVLAAETLPLVDLSALARSVRLRAADVTVASDDLEAYVSAADIAARRAADEQTLRSGGEAAKLASAAYDLFYWTRRSGARAVDEAEHAVELLAALPQPAPADRLRLGLALAHLGRAAEAVTALEPAAADPRTRIEACSTLIGLHAALARTVGQDAVDGLRRTIDLGAEACRALPDTAPLDEVTRAFQFYYNALSAASLVAGGRETVKLDSPLAARLLALIYQVSKRHPQPAARQQLGKLVVAVGFVARSLGAATSEPAAWQRYLDLLTITRDELIGAELDTTRDPGAYFFAALCDLLRGDPTNARITAYAGLKLEADDERLIDLFAVTAVQGPLTSIDQAQSELLLRYLANEFVPAEIRTQSLKGWTAQVLQAKLSLALRETLPGDATTDRDAALQSAEAAARRASELQPDRPAGWWLLGLAKLKGPEPASALGPLDQLGALAPGYRDLGYAVALAQLLGGRTEQGLAAMAAVRPGL